MNNTRRNRRNAGAMSRRNAGAMSRRNRRNAGAMSRRNRRNAGAMSRRNAGAMSRRNRRNACAMGGSRKARKGLASGLYRPVGALGTGAGRTLSTAAKAAINVFDTGVRGIDETLKTAAGTINNTVSKIIPRSGRRANRR